MARRFLANQKARKAIVGARIYLSRIFPSFSWGIFGHVTRLGQSRVWKKYLMDYKASCFPEAGILYGSNADMCSDVAGPSSRARAICLNFQIGQMKLSFYYFPHY